MGKDNERWDHESCKHIGFLFRLIDNGIKQKMTEGIAKDGYDLTSVQCATLSYIKYSKKPEIYQKDLENTFSISGATATNILKRLEAQDLVTRIPNKKDARLKSLVLTEKGREMEAKSRDRVKHMEETIIQGMTEEEITIFRDLLRKALQNIEDMEV